MKGQQQRNSVSNRLLETTCTICGSSTRRMVCHEIRGTSHRKFSLMGINEFTSLMKSGNFVRLCFICHKHVHWSMDFYGYSWEDILDKRIGV